VEIQELHAGDTRAQTITVQAEAVGDYVVTSTNFSYRNEYGTPVRIPDFRADLTVRPASDFPASRPALDMALASGELAPGEWAELRIRLQNASSSAMHNVVLSAAGPVRIAPPGPRALLPGLAPGEAAEISFIVCPSETGSYVPAELHATYVDGAGQSRAQNALIPLVVRVPPAARAADRGPARRDTILYLATNPQDLPPLRSDKEMREIHERLQLGKDRDRFRLKSATAAQLKDIGQALADYDPRIVHFSGHGQPDGSVYVEDGAGYSVPVAAEGLAGLFGLHAATVDCVIVNACHSLRLGEAINRHIRHVIAMRCEIGDAAAITFSVGFYQGLAAGATVPRAFERGRAFLLAQATGPREGDTPVLLGSGPG
jgi:hypothetical protein